MKKFILLSLITLSGFAYSYQEFNCTRSGDNSFNMRVSHYAANRWDVELQSRGQPFRRFFSTMRQQPSYDLIFWNGAEINLKIDLFPDRRPRNYWNYRADFNSIFYRQGQRFYDLNCDFTGF